MKKMIVAAVAAATLIGGAAAFAALAPIGIASAQDPAPQQSTPDATTPTAPKVKPARRAAVRAGIKKQIIARRGQIVGDVATYLGITPDALKQELKSGKSLADIAGPKTQGLVEMLTTKANDRIQAALDANKIDAARATKLKSKVGTVIERLVNAKRPVASAPR